MKNAKHSRFSVTKAGKWRYKYAKLLKEFRSVETRLRQTDKALKACILVLNSLQDGPEGV